MHHALEVVEIVAGIAFNLRRGLLDFAFEETDRLPRHVRIELLECALTCHAFATAILPLMWNSVHYDDLPYLAMTMRVEEWTTLTRGYKNTKSGTRTIKLLSKNHEPDVQWLSPRFEFYARCIKSIDFNLKASSGCDRRPHLSWPFVLDESVFKAWTRLAKHRRLFPALTSLSHTTTYPNAHQPLLELIDTLRATHDICCLLVDVNDSAHWVRENSSVKSSFVTDLAAGRCGTFESLEVSNSLKFNPYHSFACMPAKASMRRLVLKPQIGKVLLPTVWAALPELRHCLVYYSPSQDDVPVNLLLSPFSHLTHLAYSVPNIPSLKDALRDLPSPRLEELICSVNYHSEVTLDDILSISSILLRWQSSLTVFKLIGFRNSSFIPPPLSVNGPELVQLITSFRYLEALRSLSLELLKYTRAETSEKDEEDGKAIASAYGDTVKEMGLGTSCLLPPPVFVPIFKSGRFSRCAFSLEVDSQSDFDYLVKSTESVPSGATLPYLNRRRRHRDFDIETCERINKALDALCVST